MLVCGELVPPALRVGDPYAKSNGHRLRLSVDRDDLGVAAGHGSAGAFPFHPLRQGHQAPLERLLRLTRPLRSASGRRGREGHLVGVYVELAQPLLLLGR